MSGGGPRRLKVLHLGSPAGLFGAERWILALISKLPEPIESLIGVIDDRRRALQGRADFSVQRGLVPAGTPDPSNDPGLGRQIDLPPLCVEADSLGFQTHTMVAPGRFNWGAIRQMRELVATQGIDIVHTHYYKPTLVAALAVIGLRCRLVVTPHGWSTDAGLLLQAYEMLERVAMLRAHAVAPLSKDLYDGLARIPGLSQRLHLIPNGVDLDEVDASIDLAEPILQSKARGEFVVGYIGQLIPRKRVEDLVRAFARLQGPRRLFILGDGPSRADLEVLAKNEGVAELTDFLGFRPDRLSFLRGFDVLVLPSVLEGIPRCLMEGMAARVPIVGTDIPGIRELIINEQTGALFQCADVTRLATILERLQVSSELRIAWGLAGDRRVRDHFSAGAMAERYVALYQDITSGPFEPGVAVEHPSAPVRRSRGHR